MQIIKEPKQIAWIETGGESSPYYRLNGQMFNIHAFEDLSESDQLNFINRGILYIGIILDSIELYTIREICAPMSAKRFKAESVYLTSKCIQHDILNNPLIPGDIPYCYRDALQHNLSIKEDRFTSVFLTKV